MLCCVVLLAFVGFVLRRAQAMIRSPASAAIATGAPCHRVPHTRRRCSCAPRRRHRRSLARRRDRRVGLRRCDHGAGRRRRRRGDAATVRTPHWFLRDLLFAVLAAGGLADGPRAKSTARQPARSRPALALVGGGVAWTIARHRDMHVFAMFEITHGESLHDPVFHAAGFWAVVAGSLLL